MNFENNTVVTYYSNPNLEDRIKELEERIKFLESKDIKVSLGASEYIVSNQSTITSTTTEDKSVVISYDLTNIMNGTDYKILSTDIVITGPDKNGNSSRLTSSNLAKSSITLQPHNFPATAAIRAIVVKNGVQSTLYQSVSLPFKNNDKSTFKLQNLVTEMSKREMTLQDALDYLISRVNN